MVQQLSKHCIAIIKVFNILIIFFFISGCLNKPYPGSGRYSEAPIDRPKSYVVVPGDTLFSIAWRYGLRYEALANHNGIAAPYVIRPSQIIRLDVETPSHTRSKKAARNTAVTSPASTASGGRSVIPAGSINKTTAVANDASKPISWAAPKWGWPVKGPILSSFQGNNGLNKGIDLGGKLGEPVIAAASGQVVYSGSGLRGYGKLLIIKHNDVFLSAYAHNDKLLVKEGDFVKAGQRIADMGSSGTDRVKLHFEIRRDGTPVNPVQYLPRR